MKYIDADKLKAEIEKRRSQLRLACREVYTGEERREIVVKHEELLRVLSLIDSIQQEQTNDVIVTANAFLDALSKTPYNNKPVTDAQTIVKQLLLFFNNPASYNPDTIVEQEQPEVDLEKSLETWRNRHFRGRRDGHYVGEYLERESQKDLARHFYELGLKARRTDR